MAMKRLLIVPALTLAFGLAGASAQTSAPAPTSTQRSSAEAENMAGIDILYAEARSRLTVPVGIGSSGPFPFVIDTGAERTVISRELAKRLGLSAGAPVGLASMVDQSIVNTVLVRDLVIQSIGDRHTIHAPALEGRHLGAFGMLGIDTLRGHKILIDFDRSTLTVSPSTARPRRAKRDEIVVTGRNRFGQLIVTNAYLGRHRVDVVLDTGAQMSVGNSALLSLLDDSAQEELRPTEITSVTGAKAKARYTLISGMRIGTAEFNNLPVAFADVEPFRHFELENRPALLLGMHALSNFRRVEIDFPNRQIRFLVPPPNPRDLRRSTGSLIPGVEGASPSRTY